MQFAPLAEGLEGTAHAQLRGASCWRRGTKSLDGRTHEIPTVAAGGAQRIRTSRNSSPSPCPVIFKGAARDDRGGAQNWSPAFFKREVRRLRRVCLATETDWDIQGTLGRFGRGHPDRKGRESLRPQHRQHLQRSPRPRGPARAETLPAPPRAGPAAPSERTCSWAGPRPERPSTAPTTSTSSSTSTARRNGSSYIPSTLSGCTACCRPNGAAADSPVDHNQPASAQTGEVPAVRARSRLLGAPESRRRADQPALVVARHQQRDAAPPSAAPCVGYPQHHPATRTRSSASPSATGAPRQGGDEGAAGSECPLHRRALPRDVRARFERSGEFDGAAAA